MSTNYLLVVRTIQGNPGEKLTVVIQGTAGQTEHVALDKSQSYTKPFNPYQTDLFVIQSSKDVGKILSIEFHRNLCSKVKEWKTNLLILIHGVHVYHGDCLNRSLIDGVAQFQTINFLESVTSAEKSSYYVLIKTGRHSCSKNFYPKLTLFGSARQMVALEMNAGSMQTSNMLKRSQVDLYHWNDQNIGQIEQIQLQGILNQFSSKSQWSIDWLFAIHHGYTFTGRILLDRTLKPDRIIRIDLELKKPNIVQKPMIRGQGDRLQLEEKFLENYAFQDLQNQQTNATTEDLGRYYVVIRNLDGTMGAVYMEFHGDHLESSGEQHLSKCENYPTHPFGTHHSDLFHIKAPEVGHVKSITIRLDQMIDDHSLTLDAVYLVHNCIMYQFDLHGHVLNKNHPKVTSYPMTRTPPPAGQASYFFATHTASKSFVSSAAQFTVTVTGTINSFGPLPLKHSLTNGEHPFEKECIDLFHFQEVDIGAPVSFSISIEPTGLISNFVTGPKCDRIMMIKDGEFNSLWQIVGDLKPNESKVLSVNNGMRQSIKEITHLNLLRTDETSRVTTSPQQEPQPVLLETVKPVQLMNTPSETKDDEKKQHFTIEDIIEHQRRHTYAANLAEAQQNYRELRRLLRKVNGPMRPKSRT